MPKVRLASLDLFTFFAHSLNKLTRASSAVQKKNQFGQQQRHGRVGYVRFVSHKCQY